MSSENSYTTTNPLFGLTEKIKIKLAEKLLPKRADLEPKIHHDENEFTKFHKNTTTIYEIKYYHQYEYKSLPLSGWIKPCVRCHTRTGSTVIYSHPRILKYQYFRLHICTPCKAKYKNNLLSKCKHLIISYLRTHQYHATPRLS